MQNIFIGAIDIIEKFFLLLPTFEINNISEVNSAINQFFAYIAKLGYILPYHTFVKVLSAIVAFRIWKMRLFIKNWIIKKIWH